MIAANEAAYLQASGLCTSSDGAEGAGPEAARCHRVSPGWPWTPRTSTRHEPKNAIHVHAHRHGVGAAARDVRRTWPCRKNGEVKEGRVGDALMELCSDVIRGLYGREYCACAVGKW